MTDQVNITRIIQLCKVDWALKKKTYLLMALFLFILYFLPLLIELPRLRSIHFTQLFKNRYIVFSVTSIFLGGYLSPDSPLFVTHKRNTLGNLMIPVTVTERLIYSFIRFFVWVIVVNPILFYSSVTIQDFVLPIGRFMEQLNQNPFYGFYIPVVFALSFAFYVKLSIGVLFFKKDSKVKTIIVRVFLFMVFLLVGFAFSKSQGQLWGGFINDTTRYYFKNVFHITRDTVQDYATLRSFILGYVLLVNGFLYFAVWYLIKERDAR
ncbi:hypothetical protein K4L44_09615 [Halosquirtibacter laminarini]|uniref:Uncharacterized protein n=1 Tax=Halosquirtibacter laminarini TaxID=3374600 RepID=A0AC61NMD7_9BACT|nr:hypothetical protein K4L44_09615 [Prolixibacteraceae bacterium]